MHVTKKIQAGEHTGIGIAIPYAVADHEIRGKTFADVLEELGYGGWSTGSGEAACTKQAANREEELEKLRPLFKELWENWVGEFPVSCEHGVYVAHTHCPECIYE